MHIYTHEECQKASHLGKTEDHESPYCDITESVRPDIQIIYTIIIHTDNDWTKLMTVAFRHNNQHCLKFHVVLSWSFDVYLANASLTSTVPSSWVFFLRYSTNPGAALFRDPTKPLSFPVVNAGLVAPLITFHSSPWRFVNNLLPSVWTWKNEIFIILSSLYLPPE